METENEQSIKLFIHLRLITFIRFNLLLLEIT